MGAVAKTFTGVCAAAALVAFSQLPEFAQQYAQRLGGAISELKVIVADFDRDAANSQLSREDAIFNVSRAAFEALKSSKGQILNISATLHYLATPMQIHVSAAKAGVDAITRNLSVEWGRHGIRVNGIAPGPIEDTEGMKRLLMPELKEKLVRKIPVGRFGRIEDIENAALFLVSDAANYVNGVTLVVDGGSWLLGTSLT